jgi:hypothetical protein
LYQLVDSLRRQGMESYLTPMPGTEINERAREYDGYDAPEQDIIDSHESVVVVPEIAVHLLRPLEYALGFVTCLSLDNAS